MILILEDPAHVRARAADPSPSLSTFGRREKLVLTNRIDKRVDKVEAKFARALSTAAPAGARPSIRCVCDIFGSASITSRSRRVR